MTEPAATGRPGARLLLVAAVLLLGPPLLLWGTARTDRARLLVEGLVGQAWRGTVTVGSVSYEPPLRVAISDLRLSDPGGGEPWLAVPRLTLEPSLRDPFRRVGRVVLTGPRMRLRRTAAGLEPLDRLGLDGGVTGGGGPAPSWVPSPSRGPVPSPVQPPGRGQNPSPVQSPGRGRSSFPAQSPARGQVPSPASPPRRAFDPPLAELPPIIPVEWVHVRKGEVVWVDEALPLPLTVTARDVGLDLSVEDGSGVFHALADLGPLGRLELRGGMDLVPAATGMGLGGGSVLAHLEGVSLEKSQELLPEEVRGLAGGVAGTVSLEGALSLQEGRITSSTVGVVATHLAAPLLVGASVGEFVEATVTGLHDPALLRGTARLRLADTDGSGGGEGDLAWAREGPIVRLSRLVLSGRSARVEGEGFLALGRDGLLASLMGDPSYEVALRGGDISLEGPEGQWFLRHLEARVVPGAVDVVRADLARGAERVRQVSGILALDGAGSLTGRLAGPDGAVVDVAGMLWQPTVADAGEE